MSDERTDDGADKPQTRREARDSSTSTGALSLIHI